MGDKILIIAARVCVVLLIINIFIHACYGAAIIHGRKGIGSMVIAVIIIIILHRWNGGADEESNS